MNQKGRKNKIMKKWILKRPSHKKIHCKKAKTQKAMHCERLRPRKENGGNARRRFFGSRAPVMPLFKK
jgi:hypothetical protein